MKLETAITTYLEIEGKDKIDTAKLNVSWKYWKDNEQAIIKYCIKDCYLTQKLAQYLIDKIKEAKVFLPKLLVSAGSLAKSDFRYNCFISDLRQIPRKILQIAYNTYFGGKFEIQKRGFFRKLWLYDIVSQYPTLIQKLPNLDKGIWISIKKLTKKESFSFYKVDLDVPADLEISTIPYKFKHSVIYTGVGIFKNQWLTWYDLDLMRKYITKIHEAWKFVPKYKFEKCPKEYLDFYYPFYNRINHHFKQKQYHKHITKNKTMELIHKLTMNALYGSFIERHTNKLKGGTEYNTVGILFNPIYASFITAFGRWSVVKDIPLNKQCNICAIHTDSIITNVPMDKYLDIGNNLGQWNLEASGSGVIINTGMYQVGKKSANRCVPSKIIKKDIYGIDISDKELNDLNVDWFLIAEKYLKIHKKEFVYEHMRKVSEALIRDKNLKLLNTMTEIKRSVNINSDVKRHWNSNFLNFKDLLSRQIHSKCWYIKMNNKESIITIDNVFQNPLCVPISD